MNDVDGIEESKISDNEKLSREGTASDAAYGQAIFLELVVSKSPAPSLFS
jgi:hypothetical protein